MFMAVVTALNVLLARHTGIYDVVVRRADGARVALFRGRSCAVKGPVIPEGDPP